MQKATPIFYGLSAFVLMTAFFVLQPSKIPEVASFQTGIEQQFSVAWKQTLGDGQYFDSLANIYDGITAFYDQSASATLALLTQPESDEALYHVANATYEVLVKAIVHASEPKVAAIQAPVLPPDGQFMTQAAITNIIPVSVGNVSGVSITHDQAPVNDKTNSWVTLRDNYTGQMYCLAIYNGEVNKYLGACKNDYH